MTLSTLALQWSATETKAAEVENQGKSRGKSAGTPAVWLLKQQGIFSGEFDTYLSPQGLRAEGVRSHTIIIARPPRWDIVAFNTNAKTVWNGKLEDFRPTQGTQRLLTSVGGVPSLAGIKFPRSESRIQKGVKGKSYFTDAAWTAAQTALYQKNAITKLYPKYATYFGATEIPASPQARTILERLFSSPILDLVPIEYKYEQFNGTKKIILVTFSAKPGSARPDWLTVPAGLRRVGSMEEVSMDSTSQEGLDEMLDNIRPR